MDLKQLKEEKLKEFDSLEHTDEVRFVLDKFRAKIGDVAIDDMLIAYKTLFSQSIDASFQAGTVVNREAAFNNGFDKGFQVGQEYKFSNTYKSSESYLRGYEEGQYYMRKKVLVELERVEQKPEEYENPEGQNNYA